MTLGVPHVPFFDATEEVYDREPYYSYEDEIKEMEKLIETDEDDDFISKDFEDDDFRDDEDDDFGDFEVEEEEESDEEWVELPSIFYDAGFFFVFGKIDGETATNLISSILFLNDDDERIDQVSFFINSPGGFLQPGLAIVDIMESCDSDLCFNTLGLGLVASTASLILSAGDRGCRWAYPHTRVMMHQPAGQFIPKPDYEDPKEKEKEKKKSNSRNRRMRDLTSYTDELLDLRKKIIDVYALTTKNDPAVISRDIERDFFMSAEEAQAYGIIDQVIPDPHEKIY